MLYAWKGGGKGRAAKMRAAKNAGSKAGMAALKGRSTVQDPLALVLN